MEQNGQYFGRRAREEREAALKATHSLVRERHLQMAELYEQRLRAIAAEESRLAFHLVSAA